MTKIFLRRAGTCCLAVVLMMLLICSCSEQRTAPRFADLDFTAVDPATCQETDKMTDYVKLTVSVQPRKAEEKSATYEGTIILRLFPDVAPKTVENFKSLVADDFYDGLTFHRIIKNFMIQGGDPKGNDTGDGPNKIKGEFDLAGFENNLKHVRGVLSMARGEETDTASCQFFIVHKTSSHLDGKYASFGYVVSGMEVVDYLAALPTNADDLPDELVIIESICFVDPS